MRKRIIVGIILILIIMGIKYIPFGISEKKLGIGSITLTVPQYSIFDNVCCMYAANFKSFRSTQILKKELDKIMNGYETITCEEKKYYYDAKQNLTITDYGVNHGIPFNTFYIVFDKGKLECQTNNLQ